jgi:hypothetical protein
VVGDPVAEIRLTRQRMAMSERDRPQLTEQAVLDEARRRTGLDDFGDDAFREPMRRLLHALDEEAHLNIAGRAAQFERIVGILVNRLRTEAHFRLHPEIEEEGIERPLAIVGLGRTGTTMLHRMIASDPQMFALLWYESRNPAPFPGTEDAAKDPRIIDAEAEVQAMLGAAPELIAAHPMDAHAPDEEIMLLEHAFVSSNPEAFCSIPHFAAWLEDQDATPGYAYMKRLLQFLQWQKKRRGSRASRWVLKTPHHLGYLDVLLRTLPGTKVVLTHRDPVETIPSFASLIHTLRTLMSDNPDPLVTGRQWAGKMQRMIERCMTVRARHPDLFLDVRYRELIADPMAQIRRIYAFAELDLSRPAEEHMRAWAIENARERRPAHRYTLEQFGLTEAELRQAFAKYRAQFLT